jgi:hypothetical protein
VDGRQVVEHQRGNQTREVGVGGAEKEEDRKASQSHYQARRIELILYGRDKRHSIRGDFFCGRRIQDRVEATRRDMVDLLYRFAKRPLRASRLPSADSGLDLCARCAKLRFLRLHNRELVLDKRAIHSAAADLDIAKAPARYSAIGRSPLDRSTFFTSRNRGKNQNSVKFRRSEA